MNESASAPSCVPAETYVLKLDAPLVAAFKEAGKLVHNSQWAGPPETTMRDLLAEELGRDIWPLHRLDRGTSGLLLCIDDLTNARAWNEAYREDKVGKEYLAIVRGAIRAPMLIERPIPDDDGNPLDAKSMISPIAISSVARVSLIRVRIWSGRRHQIRRHMRSISHHVVCDATWGNNKFNKEMRDHEVPITRLALHSWRIALKRPDDREETYVAPPRGDFAEWCAKLFDFTDWASLEALPWLSEEALPASNHAEEALDQAAPTKTHPGSAQEA